MSPDSLRNAIYAVKREGLLYPRAVIAVDLFGQPANYDKIRSISDSNKCCFWKMVYKDLEAVSDVKLNIFEEYELDAVNRATEEYTQRLG